jgi:hypothetical protein
MLVLLECDDLGKANAVGRGKNCHLVATMRLGSLRAIRERSVELRIEEFSTPPRR